MPAIRYSTYVAPISALDAPRPSATIRAIYLDAAREMLNKLADRAETYGQVITWQEHHFDREITRWRWDGKRITVVEKWVDIHVSGGAPKLGNHKFIAMLERLNGSVLVKAIPDVEIGEFGRNWDGRCDHCGKPRSRVHGVVIEDENGRMIIGKSCVRDYLGMDCPEMMLRVFRELTTVSEMGDEFEEKEKWPAWATSVWGVVAGARAAVALFGYARKEMQDLSTYARVLRLIDKPRNPTSDDKRLDAEFTERAEYYYEEAQKIIDWARNITPNNDYLHNVKVALSGDYIGKNLMGVTISAVVAYDNEMQRRERIKASLNAAPNAGYVGELKKRMTAVVEVDRIISINSMYGNYRLFIFRTENGSLLKWKTSADTDTTLNGRPINTRDRVKLTFTPQGHDLYEGVPQTKVNRCKVEAA